MRIIEKLSEQIEEELEGAREYIECAAKYKMNNKELAELYYSLAVEEIGHSEKLHKGVVREIDKYKATGKEVPPAMLAIWDYQHNKLVEESTEIKMLIEVYRK